MRKLIFLLSILFLTITGQADILTSANFEETTQTLDSGGVDQETLSLNFDLVQVSLGQTAIVYSQSTNFAISG